MQQISFLFRHGVLYGLLIATSQTEPRRASLFHRVRGSVTRKHRVDCRLEGRRLLLVVLLPLLFLFLFLLLFLLLLLCVLLLLKLLFSVFASAVSVVADFLLPFFLAAVVDFACCCC